MLDVFLIILALIWLVFASVSDLKKREVANWLCFSLIAFALIYRAFYSVLFSDYFFLIYGLLGLGVFFILAYLFYYARVFAGGDAKLLMGLGAVLPVSSFFHYNLLIFLAFVFLLLLTGSFYGLIYSFVLVLANRKKFSFEFKKQLALKKQMFLISLFFAFVFLMLAFYLQENLLFLFPLAVLAFPFLFVYGKSVEETCMIKQVAGKQVTVGDWLYEEVRIGKKIIKPYWEGLNEKEVKILRKCRKKIKIKQGIPFVPVFLLAFILFLLFRNYFLNLLNIFLNK